MKFCKLKIQLKWLTTWLSVATLVMSPVALGQETEKISKQQVISAIKQMGLDKQITVGEFFENTKDLYPERIRSQIEPVVKLYKNVMMPKFEVTSAKGANGIEIPTVRISQNGQILNLQVFGEEEKYVKFQNTNLSEIDIVNFNDMFDRILAGDENLRKQLEVKPVAVSKTFTQYPSLSKEFWSAMTPTERANYMIHLRLLWNDSKKVLAEIEKEKKVGKPKKTSSIHHGVDSFESFLALILPEAEAQAAAKTSTKETVNTASRTEKVRSAAKSVTSDECLVAGYVTSYSSRRLCDRKNLKSRYENVDIVDRAMQFCGPTKIACNPIVFGTPDGKPTCLDPSKPSFQIATHYDGPCELIDGKIPNRLGTDINFLIDDKKEQGRYEDNISKTTAEIEADARKFQQPNYAQTQSFLEDILKFNGKSLYTNGAIDPTTLIKIIEIKNQFEHDIAKATASCKKSSLLKKDHEPNFWKACDQLQRRYLFVAEFFQKKCPVGSTIDPGTLMCPCAGTPPVTPGSACKPVEPPIVQPPVGQNPPVTVTPVKPPIKVPQDGTCPVGTKAVVTKGIVGSEVEGAVETICEEDKKPVKEPSIWDKILKGLNQYKGHIFGAVSIFAMYKLFKPKKVALNPAGDFCPNGAVPPCVQECSNKNQVRVNGDCKCAECPKPQEIINQTDCKCGTSGSSTGGTGAQVTCWDNSQAADQASCPKQKYPCWDGSQQENALNCPEKPPTVPRKTGVKK